MFPLFNVRRPDIFTRIFRSESRAASFVDARIYTSFAILLAEEDRNGRSACKQEEDEYAKANSGLTDRAFRSIAISEVVTAAITFLVVLLALAEAC